MKVEKKLVVEVGEFADSIKDRITSFNSLALAQSLRSHAFCSKKKKEMFPRIAALHMKTPSQPLYLFTSCSLFSSSTLTNALK